MQLICQNSSISNIFTILQRIPKQGHTSVKLQKYTHHRRAMADSNGKWNND